MPRSPSPSSGFTPNEEVLLTAFCSALELDVEQLVESCELHGSPFMLRGPLDVNALASTTVALATYLTSQFWYLRGQPPRPVNVNREHASLAFFTEALATPEGWELPGSWDPIAGDYPCQDGWIRLHTNYRHHRLAALHALNLDENASRDEVSEQIQRLPGQPLEDRIVAARGIAGLQRTPANWREHPQAQALSLEPLIKIQTSFSSSTSTSTSTSSASASNPRSAPETGRQELEALRPFSGIRVLDLTRVLAGPVATGLLAAWGADVLRIDPPDFDEVAGIVPITLAGKRSIRLDLKTESGLDTFKNLLATADVLVHGYRDSALTDLGLTPAVLKQFQPNLIDVRLTAYGHSGPWRDRRGFDSIVQQSIGITRIGQQASASAKPVPLACQALDYGTGWLMAACAAHGLLRLRRDKVVNSYALSLARTGQALIDLPERIDHLIRHPTPAVIASHSVTAATFLGPLIRIGWPGAIGADAPHLEYAPEIGTSSTAWIAAGRTATGHSP